MRGLLRWAFGFAAVGACLRAIASGGSDASAAPPPSDAGILSPDAGPTIDPDTLVRDNRGNCLPFSRIAADPFVASPSDPIAQPPAPLLSRTATKMAGWWVGYAIAPSRAPAIVRFQFATNTTYAGQYSSASSGGGTAFAWAMLAPHCAPLRQWRLEGVLASGIFGEIDIPSGAMYPDGGTWCRPQPPAKLGRLTLNVGATRLRFVYASGAATYDLFRMCAAP